tara:strand:- start:536 stop:1048 length:513 start_codon:yes stop_codon:yes gene_type:complete
MTNIFILRSKKKNIAYVCYEKKKIISYVGKNGIGKKNREGDLITPRGCFGVNRIFVRTDKALRIKSALPISKIEKSNIWCIDPKHRKYNCFLKKPIHCFYENLYREDGVYDVIISTTFNSKPVKKHKGSAIFIHCIGEKNDFTEGCIALKRKDLIDLLKTLKPSSRIIIR